MCHIARTSSYKCFGGNLFFFKEKAKKKKKAKMVSYKNEHKHTTLYSEEIQPFAVPFSLFEKEPHATLTGPKLEDFSFSILSLLNAGITTF